MCLQEKVKTILNPDTPREEISYAIRNEDRSENNNVTSNNGKSTKLIKGYIEM